MELVLGAAITGTLTLIGVLVCNLRSKAVIETKLDELDAKVEKHNRVLDRLYSVETKVVLAESRYRVFLSSCEANPLGSGNNVYRDFCVFP